MATRPHATTEEQRAALGGIKRKPMQIDLLTSEMVAKKPKAGNGKHIRLKSEGTERPAVPGMASWAGGGPEGKRCLDCGNLGAVTVRRPDSTLERASAACLRYVQRVGRLPAIRNDLSACRACDQFSEPAGHKSWLIDWDGLTSRADWIDHKGVGRFWALNEREDPDNPGHLLPPPRVS